MGFAHRLPLAPACAGLLVLVLGCSPRPEQAEPAATSPPAAPSPPPIPAPPPPVGRAEILAGAAAASAAYSAGATYPEAVAALAGRRFQLALPFGCAGPTPETAKLRYRYESGRRTLRLTAEPEVWTDAAWVRPLLGVEGEPEAVHGFWIKRPWLLVEGCPARVIEPVELVAEEDGAEADANAVAAVEPPSPLPTEDTIGLAQVFEAGASRLLRRGGRPYEVTRRLAEGEAPGPEGYRLVLQGRIASGAEPIRCRSPHPDVRPTCLVRVEFDRIAFEDPVGESLAQWTP